MSEKDTLGSHHFRPVSVSTNAKKRGFFRHVCANLFSSVFKALVKQVIVVPADLAPVLTERVQFEKNRTLFSGL